MAGNYNVTVIETSPRSVTTGLPSVKFTVTNALTVRITTPTKGASLQRGTAENFDVTVGGVNGQPVANALVYVSISSGGQLGLKATTPSTRFPAKN